MTFKRGTARLKPRRQTYRERFLDLKWPSLAVLGLALAMLAAHLAGYRWNTTQSLPMGIYRVVDGAPSIGDLVAVCLDPDGVPEAQREPFQAGVCDNGTRPLLKCWVAGEGDVVEPRSEGLWVNESLLPWRLPEGHGPLAAGGRLDAGELWLLAPHSLSWDSRYFGAVRPLSVRRVEAVFRENPCSLLSSIEADDAHVPPYFNPQ